MKKTIFNLKWKLLFIILPIAILPLLFLIFFTRTKLIDYLTAQNQLFYMNILKQTSKNLEYIHEQHLLSLSNLVSMDNFHKIINAPEYESKIQERTIFDNIGEGPDKIGGGPMMREIFSKIRGSVYLIEFDRSSLIYNTPYKVHTFNNLNYIVDVEMLQKDKAFIELKEAGQTQKYYFGKLGKDVITDYQGEKKSVFLFPYYENETTEIFTKMFIIVMDTSFMPNFNTEMPSLQLGTLYILDNNNEIIYQNHPSDLDYYEFNDEKGRYVLNDDLPNDPYELLSFADYQQLNVDSSILNDENIQSLILKLQLDNYSYYEKDYQEIVNDTITTNFDGKKYLTLLESSINTRCTFLFFLPQYQIENPINNILFVVLVAAAIMIIIVILLSFITSQYFTKPINLLASTMLEVANGDYTNIVEIKTNDEIEILYNHFNIMITDVRDYQEQLINEEIELRQTRKVAITALAKLAEYRDESTGKHLERVSEYTQLIGILLSKKLKYSNYMTDKYIKDISSSSVLHDIGKVGIDSEILLKPAGLTKEEYDIMKTHTVIGGEALSKADKELGMTSFLTLAKEICFYHHEKFDGTGYPKGIAGTEIPLSARITALADVYDALTQDRIYRKAMSHEATLELIIEKDAGHFDPDILEAFKENHKMFLAIKERYDRISELMAI